MGCTATAAAARLAKARVGPITSFPAVSARSVVVVVVVAERADCLDRRGWMSRPVVEVRC